MPKQPKAFGGAESKSEEMRELRAAGGSKKRYAGLERKLEGEGMKKFKPFADGGEVAAMARRHPPKGITGNVPAEVREQLMERRRQREMDAGEKASGYAKGGSVRGCGVAKRGYGCGGKVKMK